MLALKVLDSWGDYGQAGARRRYDDAALSVFVENELKQIIPEMYDHLYPELDALTHVPTPISVSPGAMAWAYDSMDKRGQARWLGANATDIPRADVSKTRKTFPIRTMVMGYGWTIEEIEAARFTGTALDRAKADACKRAIKELEHTTVLMGDAANNLPGFLTNPTTPRMTLPNGGWATATADEMIEDLNTIADRVWIQSNRTHRANTILLPLTHFRRVMTTRISNTESTVAKFFLATNGMVRELMSLPELDTIGPNSTASALAYQKDPSILSGIIPLDYQQLDPQVIGFETVVPAREKIGGCVWMYPMAACFGDGL